MSYRKVVEVHDLLNLVPTALLLADSSSDSLKTTLISAGATVVAASLAALAVLIRRDTSPESTAAGSRRESSAYVKLLRTSLESSQAECANKDVELAASDHEIERLRTKLWRNHIDPDGADHAPAPPHT